MDHIHIDWHNTDNVQWHMGITSVPLRKNPTTVIQLPLVQGNKIAKSIAWTGEAMTGSTAAAALKSEIADLMAKHRRGDVSKVPLMPPQHRVADYLQYHLPATSRQMGSRYWRLERILLFRCQRECVLGGK